MSEQSASRTYPRPAKGAERATRRPLGYQVTTTYCRSCAPEGVREFCGPLREGDDYGIAFHCDVCGEDLKPCDHRWGPWHEAFDGRELRFCEADCGESEWR